MSFNEDWEKSKIGNEIELSYGKGLTKKERNEGKYPVYGSNGITDYHDDFLIEAPGIIVGRKGTIGKVKFSNKNFWPIDTTYYVKLLNENNDLKFWYYFLKTFPLENMNSHSAVPGLNREQVYKLKCLVPPLDTQKEITSIFSSIDQKIENNNKMNQTLEEISQAIYKSWFIDFEPFQDKDFVESKLGMIPKNWKVGNISDFVKVQNGYGFSSKLFSDEGSIGIIKIKNITEKNTVNISDTQYISNETAEETNNRYLIKSNSILIAMTGAKVGKIGIVPETNTTLYLNQRVGMLKPRIDGGIEYSYIALMTDYYQNVVKNKARGSAQANISATAIGSINVVVPPKKILKNYANIIKPILNKISSNLNQNQSLKELRDTLLPKLMSGEINVLSNN